MMGTMFQFNKHKDSKKESRALFWTFNVIDLLCTFAVAFLGFSVLGGTVSLEFFYLLAFLGVQAVMFFVINFLLYKVQKFFNGSVKLNVGK